VQDSVFTKAKNRNCNEFKGEAMKQFFITDSFLPDKGGSREYYYQVCKHMNIPVLTQKNRQSLFFDSQQKFRIIRRLGIRPDYVGKWQPKNRWLNILINYLSPLFWITFWTLIYHLKYRPQINHAGGFQFAGFAALAMKALFGTPFIVYAHGEEILATKTARLLGKYLRWIYRKSDKVIANSEYTKKQLIEIGIDHQKIAIVNPGISRRFFKQPNLLNEISQRYQLSNRKILLSVGRLTKRKGHSQVLKSLPILTRIYPNLTYVIAGDGPEMVRLLKLTKELKLSKNVLFTGEIDDPALCALYWLCDVFIMANRNLSTDIEGFGMVFLEAGAACKPVIGGFSGGVVEAVQDKITGFLIDSEKSHQITGRIRTLLDHPERCQTMGQKGSKWAGSFLWIKQTSRISQIIYGCINHKTVKSLSHKTI
jgi:phosphatidyl-myo-inositol dimannoside synthase